jgi:hypothetical protein
MEDRASQFRLIDNVEEKKKRDDIRLVDEEQFRRQLQLQQSNQNFALQSMSMNLTQNTHTNHFAAAAAYAPRAPAAHVFGVMGGPPPLSGAAAYHQLPIQCSSAPHAAAAAEAAQAQAEISELKKKNAVLESQKNRQEEELNQMQLAYDEYMARQEALNNSDRAALAYPVAQNEEEDGEGGNQEEY